VIKRERERERERERPTNLATAAERVNGLSQVPRLPQIDIREGLFFLQTRADWLLGSQPGWALGAHLLIGLIYRQVRCPCLTLPQGIGEAEIL
jgi:hypothetical protein